ncbi:182 kDa tankyrase-1-binding protein isoform X2 [Sphaerodactylus townsendi]|uniref:182 kDa tankyrase-1-binding protein isoform X2 n=1 Tax=Sphaerodactylus townsendi TaxID=933632 RepID=UPI0020263E37|nr:182 kDa tankyrase-1-binding protein isoform X2 [Sphaerodactylus townsendi]
MYVLHLESQPGDVMDSTPQSLCSPFLCTAANGRRGPKPLSSSPETGDARPKPPVKPKPCVLPKPAMPAKPTPVLRQALSEVPSAEKINLLAGPKPYSSGAGNSVKRLSFSLKGPPKEAANGKEVSPPFSSATKPPADGEGAGSPKQSSVAEGISVEECGDLSNVRKCAIPFKVKPVPVAAKPERFPGTTVEEILAKMEKPSKEGLESPDRPRLRRTFFSQEGGTAVHLGPKGYAAFRRCSSGGEGEEMELKGPAYGASHEESGLSRDKEEITSSNGQHVPESEQPATKKESRFHSRDSSSPPSMSCDGGQPGLRSPPSPGVSVPQTYQPLAKLSSGITPGSPETPAEPAQPPGAPYLPADNQSTQAELPPGSPDFIKPLTSPVEVSYGLTQAPGSPLALADPCSLEPPSASVEASLSPCPPSPSARHLEGLLLPGPSLSEAVTPHIDHSPETPSCLLGTSESPGSPNPLSDYCLDSDQPPGSPSHAQESLLLSRSQVAPTNHNQVFPLEDNPPNLSQLPLRRASEGVVQPQGKKGKEELGGSLAALPRGGPPLEQAAAGESNWSLSQSFEWSFPNRTLQCGGRRLGSPPRSPIAEAEDTGLLETELGGNISSPRSSYEERRSEGLSRREDEAEAHGSSPGCKDSWSQAVGQPEPPSALLHMSAPGGPSGGREPSSHELKGPLVATVGGFQEEDGGLLPFAATQEEEALQAMEPLPSVGQSAPPAQPCISFSEDAQMQTIVSSWENEYALDLVQESRTSDVDPLREVEHDPSSGWLDKLLASPPPSADDTKRRSTPKLDDPTGPEDLLGWSRKDLCSEFGIGDSGRSTAFGVGWAEEAVGSKTQWPDETEQDREFGTSKRDWLSSYSADDADRQGMEFAASPQDWATGTPLLGSSSQGQEDWLTAYGSSCADRQIEESDWSSTYDIDSAECQNSEPYVRKPGWPKLCTDADQGSREFAEGNTDWSSQYIVSAADRTDWPSSAENASCMESEVNTESSDIANKCSPDHHQDTQLSVRHSKGADEDTDGSSQEAAFNACQSGWPNESGANSRASELQVGFSNQQMEKPGKCSASHPASQVNIQQQPQPDAYGFSDASCPDSELSAKQSDWPTRFDLGVAQCQNSEFSVGKPDGIDEFNNSQTGWEREVGVVSGVSSPGFGAGDVEFRAQKTVWTDDYILGGSHLQGGNFSAGTGDWAKGTDVSGTEQKKECGTAEKNQGGSFDLLDMTGLRMAIDLVETSDSLIDQTRDLRTVAMVEPREVREGQDLSLRGTSLSETESPDESRKPTEKQPDSPSALGLSRLSASSDAGLVHPELPREPGVGHADLAYRPPIDSADVSDERSKALDAAEEAGPMEMDWTSESQKEYQDRSFHFAASYLDGGEMQKPETSKEPGEREAHSEHLSSTSRLLEEMVTNSAVKEAEQERPISSYSCHSGEEGAPSNLTDEQMTAVSMEAKEDEMIRSSEDGDVSQLDGRNCSQPALEVRCLNHPEQNGNQVEHPISLEGHATDGSGASSGETFTFLVDTEVLDSTAYRDRANLGRKRGHRAPVTRSGSGLLDNDRDSWMFKDSTEPRVAPVVSDEEAAEEPRSRRPRNSPLSKGVKVPLFPGLSPSALKAKLRGRNRSAEEGDSHSEAKQSPAKEAHVQRSKSCKIASGKPLVLPPKPEKTSGSEASSPNWLQVLKLRKKKS